MQVTALVDYYKIQHERMSNLATDVVRGLSADTENSRKNSLEDDGPQGRAHFARRMASSLRSLKVQCIICKEAIVVDQFQRHISACGKSNKAMQEVMQINLKQIMCNFNLFNQWKATDQVEIEPGKANDIQSGKRLRRGNSTDSLHQSQGLRRSRSNGRLADSGLGQSQLKIVSPNLSREKTPLSQTEIREKPEEATPDRSSIPKIVNKGQDSALNCPRSQKPTEPQSEGSLLLENSTLSCSLCSYTTYKKQRLRKHEWCHRIKNSAILHCFYCNQRYTIGSLAVHIRQVHTGQAFRFRKPDLKGTQKLTCPKCSFECLLKIELNSHFKKAHCSEEETAPAALNKDNRFQKQLVVMLKKEDLEALQRNFSSPKGPKTEKSIKCSKCSFITAAQERYLAHLTTHKNQTNRKCQCGFESTVAYLRQHKMQCAVALDFRKVAQNNQDKDSIQDTKFACNCCSARFLSGNALNSHMGTHSRKQPILKCVACKFRSTRRCLTKHVKDSGHYSNSYLSRKSMASNLPKTTDREDPSEKSSLSESLSLKEDLNQCATETDEKNLFLEEKVIEYTSADDLDDDSKLFFSEINVYPDSLKEIVQVKEEIECEVDVPILSEDDGDESEPCSNEDEDGPSMLRCTLCSYFCKQETSYKRHVDSHVRLNMPILQCQFCTFTGTKSAFRGHQSRCAGYRKFKQPWLVPQKIVLKCSACSFATYLPGNLNTHMYTCLKEPKEVDQ